jgi:hypothetical protein
MMGVVDAGLDLVEGKGRTGRGPRVVGKDQRDRADGRGNCRYGQRSL